MQMSESGSNAAGNKEATFSCDLKMSGNCQNCINGLTIHTKTGIDT